MLQQVKKTSKILVKNATDDRMHQYQQSYMVMLWYIANCV